MGVSRSTAPCFGYVHLQPRVGRHDISVQFTVVESLPSAAVGSFVPNDAYALFALDVIVAVDMDISFKHPCIIITVPATKIKAIRDHGVGKIIHFYVSNTWLTQNTPLRLVITRTSRCHGVSYNPWPAKHIAAIHHPCQTDSRFNQCVLCGY